MILLVVFERLFEQFERLFDLLLPLKVIVDSGSLQDLLVFHPLAKPVKPLVHLVCERFGALEGSHGGLCGLPRFHRLFVLPKDPRELALPLEG
jgi:hypothetical protein